MSLFEDTNPRELKELLGLIHSGEMVLPEFQRDFVWDPNATQDLIISIASGYPAGSLLRIRNTQELFAFREFEGAPPLSGKRPTYLILDGQQRLTSLYQAFYGAGEHRYFLNIERLLAGDPFEDCIFHFRSSQLARFDDLKLQAETLILPLSVLLGSGGGFANWILDVSQVLGGGEEGLELQRSLMKVNQEWIERIDDYTFPVVTLTETTSADAVCTIFETLNRTGVKLTVFELLTARFWPKDVNLRTMWAEAREEYAAFQEFNLDPYYLLQAISMVAHETPACRRKEVLELIPGTVVDWWDKIVAGMNEALQLLREKCGVLTPQWMPYFPMLIPLAGFFAKYRLPGGPGESAIRSKLERWFWCSVFGQAYESAANSQAAKDYTELVRWADGGAPPDTVGRFRFESETLRDVTPRQRALYRGVIALILRRRPRDFYKGKEITGATIREDNVDDHHIFPDAFLLRRNTPTRLRDGVLNRTLIDRQTNIRIGARGPSEYMPDIRQALKEHSREFDALLEGHLLPAGPESPLYRDDFEAFLTYRERRVWEELTECTGLGQRAADFARQPGEGR